MRSIVDDHFTKHYKYYENICQFQFKGNDLWQDLLQETYVEFTRVKPETIQFYHEIDKLSCIVIKIIKSLHYHRNDTKRNKQGRTSPLFESKDVSVSHGAEHINNGSSDGKKRVKYQQPEIDLPDDSMNPLELAMHEETIQRQFNQAHELFKLVEQEPVQYKKHSEPSNYLKVKAFLAVQDSNINQTSKRVGISRPYLTRIVKEGQELIQKHIR